MSWDPPPLWGCQGGCPPALSLCLSHLLLRRLRRPSGTSQAASWAKPQVPHLGGGGTTGRDHRPARTVSSLPLLPNPDSELTVPVRLLWASTEVSPTDASKVSLARGAARTQAPRWRRGQRCRGPRGLLAAVIPPPSRARTRGAHSLSACCWPRRGGLVAVHAAAGIGTGGARRAAR